MTMTKTEREWSASDALSDPENLPLTEEDLARVKRAPPVQVMRRAMGLTQAEFATRFHIPVGTPRDWEQGRGEPDQPARAYLRVIAREPERVVEALGPLP